MITKADFDVRDIKKQHAIKHAYASYLKHNVPNKKLMVVADLTLPSHLKRLYVVDLKTLKVLRAHHVAHGSGSNCKYDAGKACYFSNVHGSRKSSKGAMVTANTYTWGKRFPTKTKLKLKGLESGNNQVYARAIIIHSSNYVTDSYILKHGRAGNSWGCLAVDPAICDSLIDLVKDGTFVYVKGS